MLGTVLFPLAAFRTLPLLIPLLFPFLVRVGDVDWAWYSSDDVLLMAGAVCERLREIDYSIIRAVAYGGILSTLGGDVVARRYSERYCYSGIFGDV
jgi:hypothetical protein